MVGIDQRAPQAGMVDVVDKVIETVAKVEQDALGFRFVSRGRIRQTGVAIKYRFRTRCVYRKLKFGRSDDAVHQGVRVT